MKRTLQCVLGVIVLAIAYPALADGGRLAKLNRVLEFRSTDGKVEFSFWYAAHSKKGNFITNVYYVGHRVTPGENWGDTSYARVSTKGARVQIDIAIPDEGEVFSANMGDWLEQGGRSKSFSAYTSDDLEEGEWNETMPYWVTWNNLKPDPQNALKGLVIKNDTFAVDMNHRILSPATFFGSLQFHPCDGCEHGDQIALETKNGHYSAVHMEHAINLGRFYEADCPGKLHRLVEELIKWDVPMRYEGTVNTLARDYWDPGTYWTGVKGELYVGSTNHIPLANLLNKLPQLFSKPGTPVTEEQIDRFATMYRLNKTLLVIGYLDQVLYIDLKKGTIKKRNTRLAIVTSQNFDQNCGFGGDYGRKTNLMQATHKALSRYWRDLQRQKYTSAVVFLGCYTKGYGTTRDSNEALFNMLSDKWKNIAKGSKHRALRFLHFHGMKQDKDYQFTAELLNSPDGVYSVNDKTGLVEKTD
jgi:hypothetical protein